MIIEADEYDQSFLKLNPEISLISSLDKDHGDIYESTKDMIIAYHNFIKNTKKTIIGNKKLTIDLDYTYAVYRGADFYASDINYNDNAFNFKLNFPKGKAINTSLQLGSHYNIENAVAASSLAFNLGVSPLAIGKAIASFAGVHRRFDYHINTSEFVFIDDYAHHPEELKSLA